MINSNADITVLAPPGRPHPYLSLGASLYMPATRRDLRDLLRGRKLEGLRSLVLCTEDAVHPEALGEAMANLRRVLPGLGDRGPLRFVRPRNPEVLAEILRIPGSQNLDGVCLPKVDAHNLEPYLEVLEAAPQLAIMPIIETEIAFCDAALGALRQRLDTVRERVVCVRIGGNDLLQILGMKRPAHLTAYDTPLGLVIDRILIALRPHGYELSAPVFEHIERPDVLERELQLDVARALFAKTAIHPTQTAIIEAAYRVAPEEAALAEAILDPRAAAVFRFAGQMAETATHGRWAQRTLARRHAYAGDPGVVS
ncbi:MAG: ATP/GTP-binding protein [Sphingobacteriia bacterium]|jgi:citrate lyase beta subunit|nr:ATP/GTP-binding protein [Sphingobacteriia bacterium]